MTLTDFSQDDLLTLTSAQIDGLRFQATRTALGLTRAQWATWLGISRMQVNRIERGERTVNGTLALLVRAYGDGWRPRDVSL